MQGELVDKPLEDYSLDEVLELLTPLQRNFVEQMMITPLAMTAYRRAGGTAKTEDSVYSSSSEILRNPRVSRALFLMRQQRTIKVQIDANTVIRKLLETYEKAMQAVPVYDINGEFTGQYKFDGATAAKCIDLLMKHLGMFERDNRQKVVTDPEALRARLRQMGMDPDKLRSLPEGT